MKDSLSSSHRMYLYDYYDKVISFNMYISAKRNVAKILPFYSALSLLSAGFND